LKYLQITFSPRTRLLGIAQHKH